ncbi:hypothetical protein BH11PLA1_BH11PLA1_07710 [soil metagenome]
MKADSFSYSRAASVSLLGLVIQLMMGVGLLIYAVLAHDHAAQSGSYAILLGVAVWLVLAIVYDQHRRERLEALEIEQLDAAGAKSSVFSEGGGDDLRVASRRLGWMHKLLVPGVSLVLAGLLIALAWWRISDALPRMGHSAAGVDLFVKPGNRGWAIALGLGYGIVGFIFARFVSGMAKQKAWANLRAGAAYAVLASVIGLAMAIGQFVDLASRDDVLRYLMVVIPGLAGFLGVEIIISLLLNLYRPRKPGEIPRAAFDSPVLGFLASPDRIAKSIGGAISYQVGVDVTGTWAYQLVARALLPLVLLGAVVLWIMTTVVVVGTTQRAVPVTNGQAGEVVGPGLYFKRPWPFASIDRTYTTTQREVELATPAPGAGLGALLWTNDHNVKEVYAIVRAAPMAANLATTNTARSSVGATPAVSAPSAAPAAGPKRDAPVAGAPSGVEHASSQGFDIALVALRVPLRYRITDLAKWERFAAEPMREEMLTTLAKRELMLEASRYTDDEVIGRKRAEASAAITARIQAAFDKAESGVEVLFAGIESVHPQREVAGEFEKIVVATRAREELQDLGRTAAISALTREVGDYDLALTIVRELSTLDQMTRAAGPARDIAVQTAKVENLIVTSGGAAGAALAQARADRWTRHMSQRGQALAYGGRLIAYRANPTLYKATLYLSMLRDELPDARLYVTPDTGIRIRINSEDQGSGGNVFSSGASETPPK